MFRYDPGFFDGSEKRLQTQRAEALHKLIAAGHEAVLTTVVEEASRCFVEGGGGVGYFKRLSKVVVDASKVPAALEWLQVRMPMDRTRETQMLQRFVWMMRILLHCNFRICKSNQIRSNQIKN